MRKFLFVLFAFSSLSLPSSAAAQDFVDPSLNVGQIPTNGTDRGGREEDQERAGNFERVLNPYDPKYRPMERYKQKSLLKSKESGDALDPILSPSSYGVSFVRPADLEQNQIVLRIYKKHAVSGCADIELPQPTMEVISPFIRLNVANPVLKVEYGNQEPHYTCPKTNKTVYQDVRLNLDVLKKNNISYFYLKNKYGQDRYDIQMDERTVALIPVTQNLFHGYYRVNDKNPLMHYILPKNTLMIDAPMLMDQPAFDGVKRDRLFVLEQYARGRNLIPLNEILPEFVQPSAPPYFVVDKMGLLYDRSTAHEYMSIGYITEPETWHGGNGPYERINRIPVMAKRPGIYD